MRKYLLLRSFFLAQYIECQKLGGQKFEKYTWVAIETTLQVVF